MNFFPRHAIPKTVFALDFSYTGDTAYQVGFDLNNSLTDEKYYI